jgi:hypothetical protein
VTVSKIGIPNFITSIALVWLLKGLAIALSEISDSTALILLVEMGVWYVVEGKDFLAVYGAPSIGVEMKVQVFKLGNRVCEEIHA